MTVHDVYALDIIVKSKSAKMLFLELLSNLQQTN